METISIADKIYVVAKGKIIGYGEPNDIYRSSSSLIRQFIHGWVDGPIDFRLANKTYREDLGL